MLEGVFWSVYGSTKIRFTFSVRDSTQTGDSRIYTKRPQTPDHRQTPFTTESFASCSLHSSASSNCCSLQVMEISDHWFKFKCMRLSMLYGILGIC